MCHNMERVQPNKGPPGTDGKSPGRYWEKRFGGGLVGRANTTALRCSASHSLRECTGLDIVSLHHTCAVLLWRSSAGTAAAPDVPLC